MINTTRKRKIVFMGTPPFAVAALDALHAAGHEIVCVYTQPPRPAGRGHKLQLSAVHQRAEVLGLPVRHPKSLKKDADARADFAALGADVAVVAAYGLILPQDVLDAPRFGCINIHGSLLPRWRGAAPIQRAVLAGDDETGVCIMQMEAGLDTGPVLLTGRTPITATTTSASLYETLGTMGGQLIVEAMDKLETLTPQPQPDAGVTYAHMLSRDDGRIDWTKPASETERQLRALAPWPGVWCMAGDQRLKVTAIEIVDADGTHGAAGKILDRQLTVACGTGALRLKIVQPENRKAMDGADFMNGGTVKTGDILS